MHVLGWGEAKPGVPGAADDISLIIQLSVMLEVVMYEGFASLVMTESLAFQGRATRVTCWN